MTEYMHYQAYSSITKYITCTHARKKLGYLYICRYTLIEHTLKFIQYIPSLLTALLECFLLVHELKCITG